MNSTVKRADNHTASTNGSEACTITGTLQYGWFVLTVLWNSNTLDSTRAVAFFIPIGTDENKKQVVMTTKRHIISGLVPASAGRPRIQVFSHSWSPPVTLVLQFKF